MNFRDDGDQAQDQARRHVDDFEVGTMRVRRHLAYRGFGYKAAGYETISGLTIYTEWAGEVTTEPPAEMEPHILARFQRVRYEAYFNFQQGEDYWPVYVGNSLDEQDQSKTQFFTYIKDETACQSPAVSIIQQFVSLLSKSPFIKALEVALIIKTPCRWLYNDYDGDLLPAKHFQEARTNSGACGLFLESGALEPLKQLTNLESFSFDLASIKNERQNPYRHKPFQLEQKYLDITNDLKTTIERNWVIR